MAEYSRWQLLMTRRWTRSRVSDIELISRARDTRADFLGQSPTTNNLPLNGESSLSSVPFDREDTRMNYCPLALRGNVQTYKRIRLREKPNRRSIVEVGTKSSAAQSLANGFSMRAYCSAKPAEYRVNLCTREPDEAITSKLSTASHRQHRRRFAADRSVGKPSECVSHVNSTSSFNLLNEISI